MTSYAVSGDYNDVCCVTRKNHEDKLELASYELLGGFHSRKRKTVAKSR